LILYFLQNYFPEHLFTNLFRYISFRAFAAALFSFLFVTYFMPKFIRYFRREALGQVVRDDGPQSHFQKKGTPTMGGLIILWAGTLVGVIFCRVDQAQIWILLFSFVASGAVGFWDDYLKMAKKNSKGVSFRIKMLSLAAISLIVIYWATSSGIIRPLVQLPFFKNFQLDVGMWFYLWGFLVIVGSSNAVNLTDGLDGLAIVPVMTTAFVLMVISYVAGHALFSSYLSISSLQGSGEMAVFLAGIIGSGLGFLWFNSHPAQVFMGDVGSLSLGAVLGTSALLIHQEIVLFISGFLFVMEALSVIIQVFVFKSSKKRVFRMAPLHHHFELAGWPEPKVIVRFWILSIIFAVIALTTLKLR